MCRLWILGEVRGYERNKCGRWKENFRMNFFFLFIYKKITRGEYDKPISVDFLSLIFF